MCHRSSSCAVVALTRRRDHYTTTTRATRDHHRIFLSAFVSFFPRADQIQKKQITKMLIVKRNEELENDINEKIITTSSNRFRPSKARSNIRNKEHKEK